MAFGSPTVAFPGVGMARIRSESVTRTGSVFVTSTRRLRDRTGPLFGVEPPPPPPPPPPTNPCASCGLQHPSTSDYTAAHNYFRSLYGLPSLSTDSSLEADAYGSLTMGRPCGNIAHSFNVKEGQGENLYWAGSSDAGAGSMSDAVNSWMSEDQNYFSFSNNGADPSNAWAIGAANGLQVGHFTQIVWRSTSRVGCASIRCQNGGWNAFMVACRYRVAGNMFGSSGLQDPFKS